MHLITTVYTTVVRTRECVCVREAGGVTAALTDIKAVLPAGRVMCMCRVHVRVSVLLC